MLFKHLLLLCNQILRFVSIVFGKFQSQNKQFLSEKVQPILYNKQQNDKMLIKIKKKK